MDERNPVMVRVGDAADDVLPLGTAERVLRSLLEKDPELFAWLVGEAITNALPRKPRRRP